MAVRIKQVWIDEDGKIVPDTDDRLYRAKCMMCGLMPEVGVARKNGVFLCLGCLDEDKEEFEGYTAEMPKEIY